MTPRHLLMGAALVVAAGFAVFGDNSPDSAVVEPVERTAAPARALAPVPKAPAAVAILRLEDRATLIADDADVLGKNAGAFGAQDWTPPPPKPAPPPPPPAPSAPPLPFAYLGKAAGNGEWEVFLARGDQTMIVRSKTVIDGVYRVESIEPPGMTFTYLPLNQVQQLNIGVRD